jgi:hypothetical protein
MLRALFFRFGFVYALLYACTLPFPNGSAPERGLVAVTARLLGITGPVVRPAHTGSGDTRYDWVRITALLLTAAIAACAWTGAARRRPSTHPVLAEILRTILRLVLGFAMVGYGFAKVFRTQFVSLDALTMTETYGESSPMGVLWRMMGHSAPYTIFCGAVEALAGVLLFWRRTATLGALLAAGAMGNIVALNFSYDVPVKQWATHLFLFAGVVAWPDLPRLARVLVGRAAPAAPAPRLPLPWLERVRTAAEAALGAAVVLLAVRSEIAMRRAWGDGAPGFALEGHYEVETFVDDGVVRAPLTTDAVRWRSLTIGRTGGCRIRTMDGGVRRCRLEDDAVARDLRLFVFDRGAGAEPTRLSYERLASGLRLDGTFEGRRIGITTKRFDEAAWLLSSRGFHLVQEYPFNR